MIPRMISTIPTTVFAPIERSFALCRRQARRIRPPTSATKNRTRNRKNRMRAIPAAAIAIPPNPKTAAKIATRKKPRAQRSILPPRSEIYLQVGASSSRPCLLLKKARRKPGPLVTRPFYAGRDVSSIRGNPYWDTRYRVKISGISRHGGTPEREIRNFQALYYHCVTWKLLLAAETGARCALLKLRMRRADLSQPNSVRLSSYRRRTPTGSKTRG